MVTKTTIVQDTFPGFDLLLLLVFLHSFELKELSSLCV